MKKYLRDCLRDLREQLPTVWPVRVRMRADICNDSHGVINLIQSKDGPYFSIILRKGMSNQLALFVLSHEYAHALTWTAEHPDFHDHGPWFGLWWSKTYQVAFETD